MDQFERTKIFSDIWDQKTGALAKSLPGPILILGASGFIGSKLFFSLASRRGDVYGVSRNVQRSWRLFGASDGSNLFSCDITRRGELEACIDRVRPQVVFNLTAYGGYSWQTDLSRIYGVNSLGVMYLLETLSNRAQIRFVHAGSSSEYGYNSEAPSEDSVAKPNSAYSLSKLQANQAIRLHAHQLGLNAVQLRLYSVYGPFEDPARLISRLVEHSFSSTLPPFSESHFCRDFVYIDDVTRAFVLAAHLSPQLESGECFNIGTGKSTSLEELASSAKKIFDISSEPRFGQIRPRPWETAKWRADISKAKRLLDWEPSVSIEEGLRLTQAWNSEKRQIGGRAFAPQIQSRRKRISVVIACYRDAGSIVSAYERLSSVFSRMLDYEAEFIFVNDGSPDSDEQEILKCSSKDFRVLGLSHSRNFGSQAAFFSGMSEARGDAVVLMDGDLQDPPEVIPAFIQKWQTGAEVVVGRRVRRKNQPIFSFFSKFFYRFFSVVVDFRIPLDAGDFSLMDRRVVDELLKFSESDLFLRGLRAWVGFRQESVDYDRAPRFHGYSTNSVLRWLGWAQKAIFNFSLVPAHVILVVAVAWLFAGVFLRDQSNLSDGVFFGISLILFCLSWVAQYSARALQESKRRPRAILRGKVWGGSFRTH